MRVSASSGHREILACKGLFARLLGPLVDCEINRDCLHCWRYSALVQRLQSIIAQTFECLKSIECDAVITQELRPSLESKGIAHERTLHRGWKHGKRQNAP